MTPETEDLVRIVLSLLLVAALGYLGFLFIGINRISKPIARRVSFKALTRRSEWLTITVHACMNPVERCLFGELSPVLQNAIGEQLASQLEGNSSAAVLWYESAHELLNPRFYGSLATALRNRISIEGFTVADLTVVSVIPDRPALPAPPQRIFLAPPQPQKVIAPEPQPDPKIRTLAEQFIDLMYAYAGEKEQLEAFYREILPERFPRLASDAEFMKTVGRVVDRMKLQLLVNNRAFKELGL